jgi:hypothetical protein
LEHGFRDYDSRTFSPSVDGCLCGGSDFHPWATDESIVGFGFIATLMFFRTTRG